MYILGMESSCDETSAAIVEYKCGRFEIKSNIVASQIETHRLYGGVVPEIASRAHIEAISSITEEALDTADISLSDVDCIAVTTHPGLIGALLVGVNFAKSLAFANNIPLVSVNHINGHVSAAYLSDKELEPPFLALVVSGGHTSMYVCGEDRSLCEIATTRDDAAGEAFDKIGRVIGLPYPGGAALDKLAYEGDSKAIKLPSPALQGTMDFSFSGIKTAALNYINSAMQKGEEICRADVAASYTKTIVEAIAKQTAAALEHTKLKTLVLAGGVAANSHLRARIGEVCKKTGVKFVVPPISLCGDNGAMIAAAGCFEYLAGRLSDTSLNASALD